MEEAARTDLNAVGQRIRQARTEAGLTQDELSDLVGVGMRQIQYYEAGTSNPYRTLRRIAEATRRDVGWLLHGDPPMGGEGEGAVEAVASIHYSLQELAETVKALAHGQEKILDRLDSLQDALQDEHEPQRARSRRKTTG